VRHQSNPILTPRDVKPSRPDFEVMGAFNAGAARHDGQTILLVRIAERPHKREAGWALSPHWSAERGINVEAFRRDDPRYDTDDPRLIRDRETGRVLLTSLSHVRLARSADGVHFTVDETPWLAPITEYEAFGVEDARVTALDGLYYVNYSAVSDLGIATALAVTGDFTDMTRLGVIFPPANRDVVLFPAMVNGLYAAYHRPMPNTVGGLNIWLATSPDLRYWGGHTFVLGAQPGGWESGRVGGGAPPIRTEHGWLSIYHAADRGDRYCLGAFLTPLDDPARVIARSRTPILQPETPYETGGFFPNVVFTCGALLEGDTLRLYYGASDECIALAEAPLDAVLRSLEG
jgi:predicted GH43/DUF377 family glycosyl hydrolase